MFYFCFLGGRGGGVCCLGGARGLFFVVKAGAVFILCYLGGDVLLFGRGARLFLLFGRGREFTHLPACLAGF